MNRIVGYTDVPRYTFILLILFSIILRYRANPLMCMLYIALFAGAILNDHIRYEYLYSNHKKFMISLIFSMGIGTCLSVLAGGYTVIYLFLILYDIIIMLEGKHSRNLLIVHFLMYIFIRFYGENVGVRIFFVQYWKGNALELLMFFSIYILNVFFMLFVKVQINEKIKVKKLNQELKEVNRKLKEYSFKVEELTIENERNRVAQEIHDSLGHSLTALIMQLDFIEKIMNKDIEKSRKTLIKSQNLARDCMKDVRKAVYALKDNKTSKGIIFSINKLIENINFTEGVNISLDYSDNIETLPPEYKNIIYKIIQETITNGIRHGEAGEFNIELYMNNGEIKLSIKDNGKGCNKVIKGNGLQGIQHRIESIGGSVEICTEEGKGFVLDVNVPYIKNLSGEVQRCD